MILKQNDVNVKTFSGVSRGRLTVFLIMCLFCAALFVGGAMAIPQSLWVNGIAINDTNAFDVLGDGHNSTYDSGTQTLWLNSATISNSYAYAENYGAMIYYDGTPALTVMLNGTNTISSPGGSITGIYSEQAQLIVNGTNTTNSEITIQLLSGTDIYGINGSANVNITNCTLTILGSGVNAVGISSLGTLNLSDDAILNVTVSGSNTVYGLNASGIDFSLTSLGNVKITSSGTNDMSVRSIGPITLNPHSIIATPASGYVYETAGIYGIVDPEQFGFASEVIINYGYYITTNTTTNGSIFVMQNVTAGDSVTITAVPIAGYQLSALNYSNGSANTTITFSDNLGTFEMPPEDITINANFTQKAGYDTQTVTDQMANFTSTDGNITVNLTISTSSVNGKHMAIALESSIEPDGNIALSFDLELDPDFILGEGDYVLINATVPISNFSGVIPRSITMKHFTGVEWVDVTTTTTVVGDYILVSGNVSSFSPFAITYTTPSTSGSSGISSSGPSTSYTVLFVSDGATIYTTVISGTNVVTPPADPVKTGYTFGGWYIDEAITQKWGGTISGDTTLYAKWISNSGEPVPTATQSGGAVPTSSGSTPVQTTAKTPVPFLGILAGLGALAFFIARRE